jgi:Tol biopolymer transport system component/DNA-binding winged helix-turn-helix (wHTH) protein
MGHQPKQIYEFGPYRLDSAERLLMRDGEVVPLQPKVFDLLLALVERHGRLLEKDELMRVVWPDAIVEEANLANNISILRKTLSENGERFIETTPKRGYRFVAVVKEVAVNGAELVEQKQSEPDEISKEPGATFGDKGFTNRIRSHKLAIGVILAALIIGIIALIYLRSLNRQQPQPPLALIRLTFDAGLQSEPTWSPDGRWIAYSSDRSGNFDIWVRPIAGGDPVQVTKSPAHDWQPDWSPTGNQIVFRSERNGGGLFVVPQSGGAEHKIADFGYLPRWSRDGSQILFSSSALQYIGEAPRLYVVGLDGSPPREVLAEFLSEIIYEGMTGFAWRPDGQRISIWANHKRLGRGFWTLPLAGGAVIKSEITTEVERQIKAHAVTLNNFLWAPTGRYLYFEGVSHGVRNLWRVTVEPQTLRWVAGPDRLTTSPGEDSDIAISADGKKIAFTTRLERTRVWSLPFDPISGQLKGDGRPETRAGIDAWWFDVTRDGKQLAFVTRRADKTERNAPRETLKSELWKKSLVDGKETILAPADEYFRLFPQWSRDGSRLAYQRTPPRPGSASSGSDLLVLPAEGGEEQLLSSGLGDWSADGKWFLECCRQSPQGKYQICLTPISTAPAAENARRVIAADPDLDFFQTNFSPDARWIAIQGVKYGGISTIYVIPVSGGALTQVTDGKHWDDKPRWAPDGKTIYFVTNRGGFLNVWGIRFDLVKGQPVGEPFRVTAFESPSQMVFPRIAPLNIALTVDRLFLNITEMSGSVWIVENVDR